jgi:hypothetical protein
MATKYSGTRGGHNVPTTHSAAQDRNNRSMGAQPQNAHAADTRNAKLNEQIMKNATARSEAQPKHKDPSQNPLPAITKKPPAGGFPAFKKGEGGGRNTSNR